jgi:1-acyl-sn-glycerol-3-phosphate acyltransferase
MTSSSGTHFVRLSRSSRVTYAVVRTIVCGFTRIFTRLQIEGVEHLPASGAYVLAPTHRSYVDTPIVACVSRRRIRFMGKQEIWKNEQLGWFFGLLGAFPVARGTADREALKRCIAVLDDGEPLVLFPEGERKDGPIVQPLFDGAAYVAARGGAPIIPVGIGGSAKVMPRHAKMIHPCRVHVIIGEPITIARNEAGRPSRAALAEATAELHSELQRLFDLAEARANS